MKERALFYYESGCSCSESILLATRDCHGRITPEALRSVGAFTNGFGVGSFCCAVAAAVLVLGLFFPPQTAQQKRMILLCQVQRRFGSLQCSILRQGCCCRCRELVGFVAEELEKLLLCR